MQQDTDVQRWERCSGTKGLKVIDRHKNAKPGVRALQISYQLPQTRVKIVRSLKFASKHLSAWLFHSCILQSFRPRSSPRNLANDLQLKLIRGRKFRCAAGITSKLRPSPHNMPSSCRGEGFPEPDEKRST